GWGGRGGRGGGNAAPEPRAGVVPGGGVDPQHAVVGVVERGHAAQAAGRFGGAPPLEDDDRHAGGRAQHRGGRAASGISIGQRSGIAALPWWARGPASKPARRLSTRAGGDV